MNKMAKGAIATAAGVALLIGGGGTLAVWNDSVAAEMGTIQSGNLQLEAGDGTWTVTSASGIETKVKNIASYLIVPGDVLTYSQYVTAKLDGNNLKAKLSLAAPDGQNLQDSFASHTFHTSAVKLTSTDGKDLSALTSENATAEATVTFTFNGAETVGRESVNAAYDFSAVAFKLEQVGSTTAEATPPAAP